MSEINKRRLKSIGSKVKLAREGMGLTQEQFADKFGYARTTLAKLEAGLRDFKSTEIIKLAEQLNVSCDYLLGRTRAAAPDDFIQEAVSRFGLSEMALELLGRLNAPIDIESAERDRIVQKQSICAYALSLESGFFGTDDGRRIIEESALTSEELHTYAAIVQSEVNKQILSMLNDIFTASTGREWETYGMMVLAAIYDYCWYEFADIVQPLSTVSGRATYTLTPDMQRQCKLLELNNIVAQLRDVLTGR